MAFSAVCSAKNSSTASRDAMPCLAFARFGDGSARFSAVTKNKNIEEIDIAVTRKKQVEEDFKKFAVKPR